MSRGLLAVKDLTVLAALLLVSSCPAAAAPSSGRSAADTTVSFTRLQPGDTLSVSWGVSACFGRGEQAGIRILGSDPGRAMIVKASRSLRGTVELDTTTISLSLGDREGLDRLVAYYKTVGSLATCTTVERVVLSLSHRGHRGPTLSFTDATCEADAASGVVTLREIYHRPAEALR